MNYQLDFTWLGPFVESFETSNFKCFLIFLVKIWVASPLAAITGVILSDGLEVLLFFQKAQCRFSSALFVALVFVLRKNFWEIGDKRRNSIKWEFFHVAIDLLSRGWNLRAWGYMVTLQHALVTSRSQFLGNAAIVIVAHRLWVAVTQLRSKHSSYFNFKKFPWIL